MFKSLAWMAVAIGFFLQATIAASQQTDVSDVSEAIRVEIEQLRQSGILRFGDVEIAAGDLLAEVYERRNFAPNWTGREEVAELLTAIRNAYLDGLDPQDYHLKEVEYVYDELGKGNLQSAHEQAALDVMLSDSLFRLGYHQRFGKVNPENLDSNWNFKRRLRNEDPAMTMQEAMDAPSLLAYLDEFVPRGPLYRRLRTALADYRALAQAGGWLTIPAGATLKPGASDVRVPAIAARLAATGDIAKGYAGEEAYGDALTAAVRRFQSRHGLDPDGVIGPATLSAMNVPVEARIEQLRVNLERARWVLDDVDDYLIVVNIAGFRAYVVRNGQTVWETAVQVGRAYQQTPVFRDEMKYVVFNPTWTVPYSIATKEMLPKIKADPGYFDSRNFEVRDRSGTPVDPNSIDWSQLSAGNFPYTLVERPGASNAMGRVKFMFPNEHAVYLHDTPSKWAFDRAERTFSHGCVRIQNPFDFAEILLGSAGWDKDKIQATLDSLQTETVYLPEPVPVLLLYWTAEAAPDGDLHFYPDVYSRDRAIAQAMTEPFRAELPQR